LKISFARQVPRAAPGEAIPGRVACSDFPLGWWAACSDISSSD
jgi:hypothetical protein